MTTVDCAIIGGGPAGLNAALILGRARRKVLLFDDNNPRNAVTQHSHGFITRDGVTPADFRAIGYGEIARYPSVEVFSTRIAAVHRRQQEGGEGDRQEGQEGPLTAFELVAEGGEKFRTGSVILATGLRETLPAVEGIYSYYGKSLFNCPYCDGWELRDKPLVIIAESPKGASHLPKVIYNWSRDIVVCTNGHRMLTDEQKALFEKRGIKVIEDRITALVGQDGQLEHITFENHRDIERAGGFVEIQRRPATTVAQDLGCETDEVGSIVTDELGRTNIEGVYAAGDIVNVMQNQLIWAAASGSRAAIGVNTVLTAGFFDR
ncbi:MAG: NAD(P)/FAD-dependent oxidoreductase [Chloroflexota bacterium]|nr:NAD(P)/FAD-dependent oxidoreductase [Chloroflexota bacterium]